MTSAVAIAGDGIGSAASSRSRARGAAAALVVLSRGGAGRRGAAGRWRTRGGGLTRAIGQGRCTGGSGALGWLHGAASAGGRRVVGIARGHQRSCGSLVPVGKQQRRDGVAAAHRHRQVDHRLVIAVSVVTRRRSWLPPFEPVFTPGASRCLPR
jgi:hypothetical protein